MLLLAALSAADAAPNIPPSELPGRERYRFTPSPLDRFMQPQPLPEPLIRRGCVDRVAALEAGRMARPRLLTQSDTEP